MGCIAQHKCSEALCVLVFFGFDSLGVFHFRFDFEIGSDYY